MHGAFPPRRGYLTKLLGEFGPVALTLFLHTIFDGKDDPFAQLPWIQLSSGSTPTGLQIAPLYFLLCMTVQYSGSSSKPTSSGLKKRVRNWGWGITTIALVSGQ